MERGEALELLGTAEHLKRRTRAVSRRYWFPLVAFGLVILASTPLYVEPPASGTMSVSYVGGFFVSNAKALSLYWLLATAAGYLATAFFYRWSDRRSGVSSRIWPFVVTGVGLFVLLILVSPGGLELIGLSSRVSPWFVAGDLFIRGLTPILPIAIGLLVLSAFERSVAFAAYSVAFMGVTLLVNLYDMGNLTYRLGLGQHGVEANVLVAAVALLAGGAGFYIAGRRRA